MLPWFLCSSVEWLVSVVPPHTSPAGSCMEEGGREGEREEEREEGEREEVTSYMVSISQY